MTGQDLADRTFAALVEVGRRDLALLVHVFEDDDGTPYVEAIDPDDLDDPEQDLALIARAEQIARGPS